MTAQPLPSRPRPRTPGLRATRVDAVVIGAGFGGLATALRLSEQGVSVALCEALAYPGGCASTFKRAGYRFESGATLFSGLAPEQLFGQLIARYDMDVEVDLLDPVVTLRTPDWSLDVPREREGLIAWFTALPGAPKARIEAFFAFQKEVADTLWSLFDDPRFLPPLTPSILLHHTARLPRYRILGKVVLRSLESILERFELADFKPLRTYLDAVCQITVQADAASVEAPFALGAMDYYFRGTGHIRGGIGKLAAGMVAAVERNGGDVYMANAVKKVERSGEVWRVHTRRGVIEADVVVGNLLPQGMQGLLGDDTPVKALSALGERVEQGWGAAMLYLVVKAPTGASPHPHHIELVGDEDAPFIEGNHLFCSISGSAETERAPEGYRTMTVSTHVDNPRLYALSEARQAEVIDMIHATMRRNLERLAPEWVEEVAHEMTASPRTFARFTRRHKGYVGGIPRRRGIENYTALLRSGPILPDLYIVGDSVFPGQSTLACALGGTRLAKDIVANLSAR